MQAKVCAKCNGTMTEGFITDQGHGIIVVPHWVEGPPQISSWVGVKLSGKAKSQVSTWRCRRCGYLENYAAGEPDLRHEARVRSQSKVLLLVVLAVTVVTLAAAMGLLM
jgi:hypothetical protein